MASITTQSPLSYTQIGEQILVEINQVSQSMNDLITDVVLLAHDSLEQVYSHFGDYHIQYLQACFKLSKIRSACEAIAANSSKMADLGIQTFDKDFVALSYDLVPIKSKFRFCQESLTFVAHCLVTKGLSSHILKFENLTTRAAHGFNLLGFSDSELNEIFSDKSFDASKPFDMGRLKKGYIIDGYLNYHGPVTQYQNSSLAAYMTILKINTLVKYGPVNFREGLAAQVTQEVEILFQHALSQNTELDCSSKERTAFLSQKLKEKGEILQQRLVKCFPNTQWKMKVNNGNLNVWLEGEEKKLKEVNHFLSTKGLTPILRRVVNKETYCLVLTNPPQDFET
jgi:hypothetical protein